LRRLGRLGQKVAQIVGQVFGRRVPLRGSFGQRLEADAFQLPGDGVIHLPGRARLIPDDLLNDTEQFPPERPSAGQQLEKDRAEAIDIRTPIHPMALAISLFGTHVGGRTRTAFSLAEIFLLQGQPEIDHERLAAAVEQDVAGLDVPVDQPLAVGVVQRLGNRRHQCRRLPKSRSVVLDLLGEGGALDELRHHEERVLCGAADVEDGHDMGMIEVGDNAGFVQVLLDGFGPTEQVPMRHLDRHEPVQLLIVGQVNQSEAAFTEDFIHPIAADPLGRLGQGRLFGRWIRRHRLIRINYLGFIHGPGRCGVCLFGWMA